MIRKYLFNTKRQPVGSICDKNIYRSKRKGSKHILKVMDAWGIDTAICEELATEQCETIRILDEETNIVWSVPFDEFMERAIAKNFVGEQLFLPRKYWGMDVPVPINE